MTAAAIKLKYITNLFRTRKPENIAIVYPYTPSNNPSIYRLPRYAIYIIRMETSITTIRRYRAINPQTLILDIKSF